MYSQDPTVRRRRVKLRFFAYGVMTIATVTLAAVGVFYVLGYRLDNSLGLQQGGLVKFDSRPQGAAVTVDGVNVESTPYQANLPVGEHTVSYSNEGYQGWQKTVGLRAGEVLWLNYARLIPTSITTSSIKQLEQLHQVSTSPNRELYLLHQTPSTSRFTLMDASNESDITETSFEIPEGTFTAPAEGNDSVFEVASWDKDSDYILVLHRFGETQEFIRVPVDEPAESINISRLFKLDIRSVQYAANNADIVFALAQDNTLYRLDVNDEQNPVRVAGNVSAYDNLDDNHVAYVAEALGQQQQGRSMMIWQRNAKTTELLTVPPDVPVFVSYNPYLTRDYVSLISESSISVIQDPLEASKKTVLSDTLAFTPARFEESPGNRFFLAQQGAQVYVYDVELGRSYPFTAPAEGRQLLQWVDDHHVAFTGGGNLRLVEFDGTNMQFITSISGTHDILIGSDGEVLLSVGQNAGSKTPVIQRSYLLTEEDR